MKTFLTLCCLSAGLSALPRANAATVPAPLPSVVHMAPTVVLETGGRRHYRQRHSRLVRRVYYRHGRRVVVYRRVYY